MPRRTAVLFAGVIAASLSLAAGAVAQTAASYPNMAPIEQYLSASQADEIALARSAAPASISDNATVLALSAHGYETAAQGANGFVCIVQRAWANDFSSNEFWNPKLRAPICFNAAAAHSVLPEYLQRTQWVLAGASKSELLERTRAALTAGAIAQPEPGAMCYMMSRRGYLGDAARGPWHPHLMFFFPRTEPAVWGANVADGAVIAFPDGVDPLTTFLIPVPHWSDGSPDAAAGGTMSH